MAVDLEKGVVLRLAFREDEIYNYCCKNSVVQEFVNNGVKLATKEHNWETRVRQEVIRVKDGLAHLLTVSEPVGEVPCDPICAAQVRKQTMYAQMDSQGVVRETAGSISNGSYAFPEKAVRAGDSWETPSLLILPGMPAPAPVQNTYTVVGTEDLEGVECVRIDMQSTKAQFEMLLPDGAQKAKVESTSGATLYWDPLSGKLLRVITESVSVPHIADFSFRTVSKAEQTLVRS